MHSIRQTGPVSSARLLWFRATHLAAPRFHCPVCEYRGPFRHMRSGHAIRKWAKCPHCGSLERHRLSKLVLDRVLAGLDLRSKRALHFAPEPFFRDYLAARFGTYETADIGMRDVDHRADLQALPFPTASYDFIFCSHVLEHVRDDARALAEISRVLKRGGLALLPVPIVSDTTIEYPEPNPREHNHVRAPGSDYYDRYGPYFARVETYSSDDLPAIHQLHVREDRSVVPPDSPLRRPQTGDRHPEIIPVCYA